MKQIPDGVWPQRWLAWLAHVEQALPELQLPARRQPSIYARLGSVVLRVSDHPGLDRGHVQLVMPANGPFPAAAEIRRVVVEASCGSKTACANA